MSYTSVILRCPDALYAWFEERLTGGATVEQIMITALYDWQRMSQARREHEGAYMTWLNARLAELAPAPQAFQAPLPVVVWPVVSQERGAAPRQRRRKQRHNRSAKEQRRAYAR